MLNAMLYLACTLGLRSKEISLICLDDISFSKAEISLCNRKNTLPLTLPLPEDTIKAIAACLVGVRPKSNHRTLFLSLQPPYEPLCLSTGSQEVTQCHSGFWGWNAILKYNKDSMLKIYNLQKIRLIHPPARKRTRWCMEFLYF
jgi:integrase